MATVQNEGVGEWSPLSHAQRGVWWEHQLAPAAGAYTLCSAIELDGAVDAVALQTALDSVVAQQGALRCRFEMRRGEPGEVVQRALRADLRIVDLTGADRGARTPAAVAALLSAEARRPFDLTQLPLWRTTLIRLAPAMHVLVVARHHLIADGHSMSVWFDALNETYAAALRGSAPPAAGDARAYAAARAAQHAWQASPACAAQRDYWIARLSEAPARLLVPPDFRAASASATAGAVEAAPLTEAALGPLLRVAEEASATPYMALLAVVLLVLHRTSGGARDLVVRAPIDVREAGWERVIGFLINSVVLRAELVGDPSFVEWLRTVRKTVLGAAAHRELPYPDVISAVRQAGNDAEWSVPTEVAYQRWPATSARVLGLPARIRAVDTGAVRSPLAFVIDHQGQAAWMRVEYRKHVYASGTIARLLRSVQTLAASAGATPERAVSMLSSLSAEDRRVVLLGSNRTHRSGTPESLPAWLAQAPVSPEALAVVSADGQCSWTYGELAPAVRALAASLQEHGVGPGTVVAVALARNIELIVALWAIVETGAAWLPLDIEAPGSRQQAMLSASGARVLVADEERAARLGDAIVTLRPLAPGPDAEAAAAAAAPLTPVSLSPEDAAYVVYTSGSTGSPKAVVITQRGFCNRLRWMLDAFAFSATDRIVQKTTLTFDASAWEWVAPRLVGGCVVLASPDAHRNPASLARTLGAGQVTILQVVPSLLEALLDEPELSAGALRQVFCAGEVLTADLATRWHARTGVPLCNTYGPSEASIDVTAWECAVGATDPVPIGRPIDNTRAYVLDDGGFPVGVGEVGALCVAGAGLARGYLGQAALTAARFVPCPFGAPGERMYVTGDRARWRADGALLYAGRADTQLKVRGVRIEPGEIETALEAEPGVTRAVVVVATVNGTPTLTACVVAPPSVVERLAASMTDRLPSALQPGRYVALAALPLTTHGKVDRAAVTRLAMEAPPVISPGDDRSPRDECERQIARLWSEVLGVTIDDRTATFFSLGGHSLLAVRLLARLETQLGLTLTLAAFFADPTLAGMREKAQPIAASLRTESSPAVSAAQRRLWFLDQWAKGPSVYMVAEAYALQGTVDVAALHEALTAIVARHEVLRTRIAGVGGEPRAQTIPATEVERVPLRVVDLRDLPAAAQADAATTHRAAEATTPVPVDHAPLLRALVIRRTDATELVVSWPHVISDARSSEVLWNELAVHYRAARRGTQADLPALAAQYRDFVAWEQATHTPEALAAGLAYWHQQLAGTPPVRLPSDRPEVAPGTTASAVETLILEPPFAAQLREQSRAAGVTPFIFLLAAWQALVHRYTGETDIAVGTVIDQRHRPEWQRLIGLFLNTLLLRTDLTGDPTGRTLLARVRTVALGAYAHQNVPFDRVVEALAMPGAARGAPVCPLLFVHQRATAGEWILDDDVTATAVAVGSSGAKSDLTLIVTEGADRLALTAEFATALFDAPTVRRLLAHYHALLQGLIAAPNTRVSRLPLFDADEAARLILASPDAMNGPAEDVMQAFDRAASAHPERIAIVHGVARITYGDLAAKSNQLARHLRGLGVGPEICVALCLEPSVDFMLAVLATLKAGGAYLPLDPMLPPARIARALEATAVPFLIVSAGVARPEGLGDRTRLFELETLIEDMRLESTAALNLDFPDTRLVYVVLTSGSTGEPKAAAVEHRGLANLARWYASHAGTSEDRTLILTSPSFDLTQKNFFVPLIKGAEIHFPTWHPADHRAAVRAIADKGVTIVNCTPTAFYPLIELAREDDFASIRSLRYVFLGGEPIVATRLMPWLQSPHCSATVFNTYGPTECSDVVSSHVLDRVALTETARVPIGRPVPDTTLAVLDPQLQPVPENVEGELCIGGVAVGRGYLRGPRATAARFRPDPFSSRPGARMYCTGDRVRRRGTGELEFIGRADRQIKLRGYRIELGEIENVLERHPAVKRAVVSTHVAGRDDIRLVAYVVPSDLAVVQPSDLRPHAARSLPEFMVPSAYVSVSALPLTRSGKVDYARLPPPSDEHWARAAGAAPSSPTEERLCAIWSSLLGASRIGVNDDFFLAGGHSLLAVQMASRVGEAFGLELPLHVVFERSTLASLAEYLDAVLVHPDIRVVARGLDLEESRL